MKKTVVIVYRKDTETARQLASELAEWLRKEGAKIYSHPRQKIDRRFPSFPKNRSFKNVDLVIVLGGDGTYLEAVRLLQGERTPILGVNMGNLGFLTETRLENMYPAVRMALEGKMEKRLRSMLEVKVMRGGRARLDLTALNDVVIDRGLMSQLLNLGIHADNQLVSNLKADGLIIATPTGSTAYTLAAGGPILHPSVKGFVLTPICPHSLTNRPIIFPDTLTLEVTLNVKAQKAFLTVDGQSYGQISARDKILLSRAKCDHFVLRRPSHNYFNLLRQKLKFGER